MNLEKEVFELNIKDIMPNRFQPREIFDEQALNELAMSIKEHGVIQPIIVRKVGDKYEIIAGERRYRASLLAGKETIPALVRDIDDKETAKIALLENLQRSDLTPIEEAKTYQTILKLDNITQDELAANLGKSQSAVANKLRLLNLDEEVQTALLNKQISERHARSLLNINQPDEQRRLLNKIIINRMTVRQLDEEIMALTGKTTLEEEQQPTTPTVEQPEIIPQTTPVIEPTMTEPQIMPVIEEQKIMPEPTSIPVVEEQPRQTNIFDMLREKSQEVSTPIEKEVQQEQIQIPTIEIPTPVVEQPEIIPQPTVEQPIIEETVSIPTVEENKSNYNQVYDLRFAINNVRQAVQNTEKFGFNIDVQEFDLDNIYQIIIKIDKNKF